MEINDVLTDPCPQCALKHLSAALTYLLELPYGYHYSLAYVDEGLDEVYVAIAYINMVEVCAGYASHVDYAYGMLVLAEESSVWRGKVETAEAIRKIRLAYVERGLTTEVLDALCDLRVVNPRSLIRAHIHEALRELPILADRMLWLNDETMPRDGQASQLIDAIKTVRHEFFGGAQPAQTGGDTNGQG